MSETLTEIKEGFYESRRREFLRDFSFYELINLMADEVKEIIHFLFDVMPQLNEAESKELKELIIDYIISNRFDKQINNEVK